MQLPRASIVAASATALLLLCADSYAIAVRMREVAPPQLFGLKLGAAVLLQLGIVVGVYAYVAWLKRQAQQPEMSIYKAWRVWPSRILTIVLLGAFSATLFYNGAVCGDKPLPTVRGVGLCS